jgi:GntR family transcriptional regulator
MVAAIIPHYRRIEQALRERIAGMQPGDALPSDAALVAEFGVSRMTARNAMQLLAAEGLVVRRPGHGSFVAPRTVHRSADRLMSFSHEMRRRGRAPGSRVLERALKPADPSEASRLGLRPGARVVLLRRVRLADGDAVAVETAILDGRVADAVMGADLESGSLHEALARGGFRLGGGTATITAESATREDVELLGVRRGDALLVERRVIVDEGGRPIEATESRYLGERYALDVQFDVERQGGEAG